MHNGKRNITQIALPCNTFCDIMASIAGCGCVRFGVYLLNTRVEEPMQRLVSLIALASIAALAYGAPTTSGLALWDRAVGLVGKMDRNGPGV